MLCHPSFCCFNNINKNFLVFFLIFPSRSKTSAVCACEFGNLLKLKLRLLFHDPELADAVIQMDHRVTHRIHRDKPLIVISAVAALPGLTVGTVDHALMVHLDQPKIFKSRASWYYMSFVPSWQLHRYPQRNQLKLPLLHLDLLRSPEINPVSL